MNRDKNGRFTKKVVNKFEGLPEKWCINRRNHPEVQKWFNENSNIKGNDYSGVFSGWMTYYPADSSGSHTSPFLRNGYVEITIDQFKKYVLKQEEEYTLPVRWCIKLSTREINDAVNSIKLWKSGTLDWTNNSGYTDYYIGFDGNYNRALPERGYTPISFEQFKKYVLKEKEFVLPDKWCIQKKYQEVVDWLNRIHPKGCYNLGGRREAWAHNTFREGRLLEDTSREDYTKITIEQFRKYVLKQEEKKIVGYKFTGPKEFEKIALSVAKSTKWSSSGQCDLAKGSIAEDNLRQTGALDMWFTPVYEDEVPKVEIRGYKATFGMSGGNRVVTFGCKTFNREEILNFVQILDRSGLIIETYDSQVRAVAQYFKDQK